MGNSKNAIEIFNESLEEISSVLNLRDIEIEESRKIRLNLKEKKKIEYIYRKDYNSVEEFNNRNGNIEEFEFYIAYGSNLSLAQMSYRCSESKFLTTGYLEDYRLEFRDKYANIKKEEGVQIPVVVYKISKKDEKVLDSYERDYIKKDIEITDSKGNKIKGFTYIMTKKKKDKNNRETDRRLELPSKNYFELLRKSYKFFGFKEDILIDSLKESFKELYNL